jgi:FMN phosphatase YigB (HAD superfamily)
MKIVFLPQKIEGLVFDIDLTLYGSKEYYNSQIDLLITELAKEPGKPLEEALKDIDNFKKHYSDTYGGRKPALGQIFLHFGVSIEKNCEWRTKLFRPEDYLSHDERLVETLTTLAESYSIGSVTNNTTPIALRTLDVLGVRSFFAVIVGLDRSHAVKPSIVPFEIASKEMRIPLTRLVSIGDRMEVDIELPVGRGMGGILVENMEDVYALTEILAGKGSEKN